MTQHTNDTNQKSILERISGISTGILALFVLFIALFLVYFSIRYSYYSPTSYNGPVLLIKDHTFGNLWVFGAVVLLSLLLHRLFDKKDALLCASFGITFIIPGFAGR